MLKEEVMAIKESLQHSSLDQFRASDGWLDTQKSAYAIKERQIVDEAGDVAEETVTSWMERIQKLTEGNIRIYLEYGQVCFILTKDQLKKAKK